MDTEKYLQELCRIASGSPKNKHLFRSVLGEKFLEGAAARILGHLIEIKQEGQKLIKNPAETKLLHHYTALKELLTQQERINTKDLHFSSRVMRLYMEGDAQDSTALKKEVAENAEDWIYILKKIYERANTKTKSFSEDMKLWEELHEKIMSIRKFYHSEEYRFMSECLEATVSTVLKYTLENLLLSEKIYRLSFVFVKFYSEISCDFINKISIGSGTTGDSEDDSFVRVLTKHYGICMNRRLDHEKLLDDEAGAKGRQFVEACSEFLKRLRLVNSRPKVVKQSVYCLVNYLRLEMLAAFCAFVHEGFFELFAIYNELAQFLTEATEDTFSQCTAITIEELTTLTAYMSDVQRICGGIRLYKNTTAWLNGDLQERLLCFVNCHYEKFTYDLISEFRKSVSFENLGSGMERDFLLDPDQTQNLDRDIEESEIFAEIVGIRASCFNSHIVPHDIDSISSKLSEYSGFYSYRAFMRLTEGMRTDYLLKAAEALYFGLRASSAAEYLALAGCVATVEKILVCYEDSRLAASLRGTIMNAGITVMAYLETFSWDALNSFILMSRPAANFTGTEGVVEIISCSADYPITSCSLNVLDDELRDIRMVEETNKYFNLPKIHTLFHNAQQIENEYRSIKSVFDTYVSLVTREPELFFSAEVDEFLRSLVNLKWKYFQEHSHLDRIIGLCAHLEMKYSSYCRMLSNFLEKELPAFYEMKFVFDPDIKSLVNQFDVIKLDSDLLRVSLSRKIDKMADVFCDLLVYKLKNNISYAKYDIPIQFSKESNSFWFDSSHKMKFIDFMQLPVSKIPKACGGKKPARELITDKWASFSKIITGCGSHDDLPPSLLLCKAFTDYYRSLKIMLAYCRLRENRMPYFNFILEMQPSHLQSEKNAAFDGLLTCLETLEWGIASPECISGDESFTLSCRATLSNVLDNALMAVIAIICKGDMPRCVLMRIGKEGTSSKQDGNMVCAWVINELIFHVESSVNLLEHEISRKSNVEKLADAAPLKKPTLQKDFVSHEFIRELEIKRNELIFERDRLKEAYSNIDFDIAGFQEQKEALENRTAGFNRRLSVFNLIFNIHDLNSIQNVLELDLQREWSLYVELAKVIDALLEKKLGDSKEVPFGPFSKLNEKMNLPIPGVMDKPNAMMESVPIEQMFTFLLNATSHFKSQSVRNLHNLLGQYQLPFSYINKLLTCKKYFNSSITIREYLSGFNEEDARDVIRRQTCDNAIVEYLNETKDCKLRIEVAEKRNKKYVANLSAIINAIAASWSDFEVINKFNRYSLYREELGRREEELARYEEFAELLKEVQEMIMGYENIFDSKAFAEESIAYEAIACSYNAFLVNMDLDQPFPALQSHAP